MLRAFFNAMLQGKTVNVKAKYSKPQLHAGRRIRAANEEVKFEVFSIEVIENHCLNRATFW